MELSLGAIIFDKPALRLVSLGNRFLPPTNSLIRRRKFPDNQQKIPSYFSRQARKNDWIFPAKLGFLAHALMRTSRFRDLFPVLGIPADTRRASARSLQMLVELRY